MLNAIPRYGARVLPNTEQLIAEISTAGQIIDGPHVQSFESAFAARLGGGVRATATSYGRMAGRLGPFIEVSNLLNKEYHEITGVEMPGRWLTIGVVVR